MNHRLIHDHAHQTAQEILVVVRNCLYDHEHRDAWEEFYMIAKAGLERYEADHSRCPFRRGPGQLQPAKYDPTRKPAPGGFGQGAGRGAGDTLGGGGRPTLAREICTGHLCVASSRPAASQRRRTEPQHRAGNRLRPGPGEVRREKVARAGRHPGPAGKPAPGTVRQGNGRLDQGRGWCPQHRVTAPGISRQRTGGTVSGQEHLRPPGVAEAREHSVHSIASPPSCRLSAAGFTASYRRWCA